MQIKQPMKSKNVKLFIVLILTIISTSAFAQYTAVKYLYDANGNRWNRTIVQEITLGKKSGGDTTGKKTVITEVTKERLLDSFGIKEIVIFPNPTINVLKVNIESAFKTPLSGKIKVFNMNGTKQFSEQTISASNDVDFSSMASGYYILKIEVNCQVKNYKVLKIN
jgi:anaerobic ribonucleoside-triphosphate reductase